MKKIIASLLFFFIWFTNAQENQDANNNGFKKKLDTITYQKTTEISKERSFSTNLKEKYSGKDFQYKENKVKKKKTTSSNNGFLSLLVFFMSSIFPFLLGGFIVFVIIKIILGSDFRLRTSNSKSNKHSKKLIYEEEDIHEINLETLLQQAIDDKNFRLAIRYYYLSTLKSLSKSKVIDYHKDKTNSEYLFEIEDVALRSQFSYLSYVYSYVWYGEFSLDETNFKVAENKYQSFLKLLV
jgi:large-conductance mechanosensitive channel